jgi:hypothetical protein
MITLPDDPAPNGATAAFVDNGGTIRPPLGGRVQRLNRIGSRYRFAFTMPPLPSLDVGRVWVSRLIRGKTEGVRMELPLLSFDPGSPGNPRVNGAGQSGSSLIVDGLSASYAIREGQWFSHVHANGRALYNAGAITANSSGQATVPIAPMLRVEPADNDVLEFAQPIIEGFVIGEEWQWEMALDHNLGLAFEIEEWE